MSKSKWLLMAGILLLTQNAIAFDDHRKGFMLGLGAGFHRLDIGFSFDGEKYDKNGIATSLKIGGGVTDQFALYYVRNASWFKSNGETFVLGISGVGGTYYLSPSEQTGYILGSGYILGAVGFGDIDAPFEEGIEGETGSAFMIGGGYELKQHVQLEATLLRANVDNSFGTSIQFTVNYLLY